MLSLMIVDAMDDFRSILTEALQDEYLVTCCRDGKEALLSIQRFCPDILVLDLMLPELDGISLLEAIANLDLHPQILATSRLFNDYIVTFAAKYQVSYLMLKPVDFPAVVRRIHDLSEALAAPEVPEDNRNEITTLLIHLGFSPKLLGFEFLQEAIVSAMQIPKQSITKELYPSVAAQCDSTVSQVERCIRSAIASAFDKRNEEVWKHYFPSLITRPSNVVFISAAAAILKSQKAPQDDYDMHPQS